ncbi:MAG: TIGR03790 family protein [Syntrophorhabdales bacterium]
MNTHHRWFHAALPLALAGLLFLVCPAGAALRPDQLVLVVNKAAPEGLRIARYYMEKRRVPRQNMIMIETSGEEEIGREEYEKEIAAPVRSFLLRNDPWGKRFFCLVLLYGVPLRIGPSHPGLLDEIRIHELRMRLSSLKERAAGTHPQGEKGLKDDVARIESEISRLSKTRQGASVDSEIALVRENTYPLEGWLPNKYYVGFRGINVVGMPQKVVAVCRLDGPTETTVYRIIDDSLFAEDHGLAGKAYFDARWPDKGLKDLSPYEVYDRAIHNTARIVEKSGRMPVVLDEREALFGPGEAPDAALYCGWYSLGKYVDAFTWVRGAVGFHVASAECTTLKAGPSTVWCKKMLEKGVAATVGPVAEPYLQSFPEPEVFFGCLLDGGTLVECYTVSNPFWSWQMVLIGDPLYRPFRPFLERRE